MLIDGIQATQVSATDRGLNYGDGLFETMRVYRGKVCLLERHLARLRESCRRVALPYPGDDVLARDIARLQPAAETEGVLRLVLTRGDSGRGYAPPPGATARRIVALYPLPHLPDELTVGICATRLGRSPALGGLKHLGRLEQVLAAGEAAAAGWDEGLMLDERDLVIEGTRHNLFFLRDGQWHTPPLDACGVAGVMRGMVSAALAMRGLGGGEAALRYDELHEVEELLLCNAVVGVRRVRELDGRRLGGSQIAADLAAPLAAAGAAWLA
jgi:4-amino-4-deoxychorismate lyase